MSRSSRRDQDPPAGRSEAGQSRIPQAPHAPTIAGPVEADESYGGKNRNRHKGKKIPAPAGWVRQDDRRRFEGPRHRQDRCRGNSDHRAATTMRGVLIQSRQREYAFAVRVTAFEAGYGAPDGLGKRPGFRCDDLTA